jgi:uncharacterized membrane protein
VDHHLLFHIFQIPFAASSDPRLGAKICVGIFGGLAVLSCYWLLLRYRVRYALVWLIALAGLFGAVSVSDEHGEGAAASRFIYLVIAIHLFFKRKYWPLLPLALSLPGLTTLLCC